MRYFLLAFLSAAALTAAPQLRLSNTTVGPLNIAVGQNGAAQQVDAGNIGDGNLALTATSSVTWITASIGGSHFCSVTGVPGGTCPPVQIGLSTSSLSKGMYTGIVTVSDPNAIDSPQTITVTVLIGGGVPDNLTLYVAPGGSTSTSFIGGNPLNPIATQPSGGLTLSVASTGAGSFSFTASYLVTATAPAGAAANSYPATISILTSAFQPDVKKIPVTINVTSQPIAVLSPSAVQFRVAQGAAKLIKWIQLSNSSLGTLNVTGATASAATWLSVATSGTTVVLTCDPTGLSPGANQATVTIATNAANGPFTVPVEMDVVAVGAPSAFFQGVRDNALFKAGDPVAPGGIVEIVGDQFTTGPAAQAQSLPLGTSLGGATVFVNDVPAPIYYVSASHVVNPGGQINFQMPYNTPAGQAMVRVDRDGQRGNSISVQVQPVVPRLLRLGIGDYAIAVLSDNVTFPIPPTPGIVSRPANIGETVVFYALGLGQTNPPSIEGQAAQQANAAAGTMVFGGSAVPNSGTPATPFYIGLTPGLVGLYQINVQVPPTSPRGNAVPVYLQIGDALSNVVDIAIQ